MLIRDAMGEDRQQDQQLASRNIRLAVLLALVAASIYIGYIVVYAL